MKKFIIAQAIGIVLYVANEIGNLPHGAWNDYGLELTGWQYTILAVQTVLSQISLP